MRLQLNVHYCSLPVSKHWEISLRSHHIMAEHSGPYPEFQYLEGGGGRITNSGGAWIKVRPWTEE